MGRRKPAKLNYSERLLRRRKELRAMRWIVPKKYGEIHHGHIFNESDMTNVCMICTCGWSFQGDWDVLVVKWNNHASDTVFSSSPIYLQTRRQQAKAARIMRNFKKRLARDAKRDEDEPDVCIK
jgi:hypothetical protein